MPNDNTQGIPAYSWERTWEGAKAWVRPKAKSGTEGTFQAQGEGMDL